MSEPYPRVEEVMSSPPITAPKNMTVEEAIEKMERLRITRFPVVARGRMQGIVTAFDFMVKLGSRKTGKLPPHRIYVASCMTLNPVTMNLSNSVVDVISEILDRKVGGFPVVTDAGELVGIVTKMDIGKLCIDFEDPVSKAFTKDVASVHPTTRLIELRDRLISKGVSIVPVVDEAGRLIGTATTLDVSKALAEVRRRSDPLQMADRIKHVTVADAFSQEVHTLDPDATVGDAARIMVDERVKGVMIVDENQFVVGLVRRDDIVRFYYRKMVLTRRD